MMNVQSIPMESGRRQIDDKEDGDAPSSELRGTNAPQRKRDIADDARMDLENMVNREDEPRRRKQPTLFTVSAQSLHTQPVLQLRPDGNASTVNQNHDAFNQMQEGRSSCSGFATDRQEPRHPLAPVPSISTMVPTSFQRQYALPQQGTILPHGLSSPRPVYNGINPHYPGLRVLNQNPPMFAVDNFLTPEECAFLIHAAQDALGPAPVVGRGAGEISRARTSSTCYLAREDLPGLLRKVTLLTGRPPEHCELPQVGRYLPTQQYLQHFDAFDLDTEDGRRFAMNGGQRTITVLIYLNTVHQGGQTCFPSLNLAVQPRQGMALVFFPATVDGVLDKLALHAALPAVDTKYVSQVWIRQSTYHGQPSKRLAIPMEDNTSLLAPTQAQRLEPVVTYPPGLNMPQMQTQFQHQ